MEKDTVYAGWDARFMCESCTLISAHDATATTLANAVFEYSLPDLKLIGHSALPLVHPFGHPPTGAVPEWITFTPDSRTVYVSNSGARSVSAIDTRTLKPIAVIPAGEVPKRINTLVLH